MMKFIDGPAEGQQFLLVRTPIFLRVVKHRFTGAWDTLDQEVDQAAPHEDVHLYVLVAKPDSMHLRHANPKLSGFRAFGEYRHYTDGPDEDTLRDNEAWTRWCRKNKERIMPAWAKEKVE